MVLVVDGARASDQVSLVAFFAQLSRNGNGLLDALVSVGTSKTAHGAAHASALISLVTVRKSRIISRINCNYLVADGNHSGITSEPLNRIVILLHGCGMIATGEIDRCVVVRHPLFPLDKVAGMLVGGLSIFGSFRIWNVPRSYDTVL